MGISGKINYVRSIYIYIGIHIYINTILVTYHVHIRMDVYRHILWFILEWIVDVDNSADD